MPFATNAPTIKDMLAAVDAGTATLAAAPAQDWRALTEAVLAAAPNATTAQVAAFASKLIRANG